MSTLVVGDLQGCYTPLRRLLDKAGFDPAADRLWFVGDLVNRGPESLQCLRFVKALGAMGVTVLGNHDLHLVSAALTGKTRDSDTLDDVLRAPDRDELVAWLRRQPLVHAGDGALLVHAGLPPQWTKADALREAAWAGGMLASDAGTEFLLQHMYGDRPDRWSADLGTWDRLRFIVNCCTRLRYLRTSDSGIDLTFKGAPGEPGARGLVPWFAAPGRRSRRTRVLFGHWSTLGQVHWPEHNVHGLDAGCVWGGGLVALRLETGEILRQPCEGIRTPGATD